MRRLVIFDLDGVLVDACEWHRVALNQALMEVCGCGYEISYRDHIETFNGTPTRQKLKKLSSWGKVVPSLHEQIYLLKQKKTIELIEANSQIKDEKQKMIRALRREGIHVACYTNSIRKTANLMLEKAGILNLFEYVLTNQDVANPKPDPEGYKFLMKHFDVRGENTFIVEDSPKGLEAARESGANVIEVLNAQCVNLELFRGKLV